jgi:acyl-CoA dehydrogenase
MEDSDSLIAFREEVKAWLRASCPQSQRRPIVQKEQIWGGRQRHFHSEDARRWFEAARDRGFTAPEWPVRYGGAGLSVTEASVLREEMQALGCRPPLYDQGLWMLGPALLVFGTEAQKQQHLPAICRGEVRWAQGYSEPSAGSDLANLQMKAEDDGDFFRVNGSKIWTTKADAADWIFCLVRTDDSGPKQQGISFLLIDLATQGVSVSPIPLISGESDFCQTFFDDVLVPKANLVGELNGGWAVAKEVLRHERQLMSSFESMAEKPKVNIVELATQHIKRQDSGAISNLDVRISLARHLMRERAVKQLGGRIEQQGRKCCGDPGLPLLMKYLSTREIQQKNEIKLKILGYQGLSLSAPDDPESYDLIVKQWAFDKALTIAGGTSEIQLNIIAKRGLGLPLAGASE